MTKKFSFYRPAIAGFLAMMTMALQSSGLSFFVAPVSEALGVGRGTFTLYYSLMAAVGAVTTPLIGRFVGKHGVRALLLFSGVWTCLGYFVFSISTQVWMFYVVAVLIGGTASVAVMLIANVILQKSYDSQQVSRLLGLVMAGSGVGGMLISSLLPELLERWGWQVGYRVMGLIWLGLCLLAVAALGAEIPTGHTSLIGDKESMGVTREQAMRSPKMYLILMETFILATACGVLQHMPSLLGGMAFTTLQITAMMSLMNAVMALAKIGQSVLYGKVGVRRGGMTTILVFAASMLMLLSPATIYPALVVVAIGLGVYTTLMPLLTRQVFGSYDFAAIWGVMQAVGSVGAFVGAPAFGTVYDKTGSYLPALVATAVLLVVCCIIHALVSRREA